MRALWAGFALSALVLIAAAWQWGHAEQLRRSQELAAVAGELQNLGEQLRAWPADRGLRQSLGELLAHPRLGYARFDLRDGKGAVLLQLGRYDALDLPLPRPLREALRSGIYRVSSYPGELVLRDHDGAWRGLLQLRLLKSRRQLHDPVIRTMQGAARMQGLLGLLLLGGFALLLYRQARPVPDWSSRLLPADTPPRPRARRGDGQPDPYAAGVRQRVGRALDGLAYGLILVARDGRIVYTNDTAEQLTGWLRADVQGRLVYTVFRTLGEDGIPEVTPAEACIRDGQDLPPQARALRARNGETRPIEVMSCLLRDHDGVVDGAAMLFRDMSVAIRQNDELRRQARLSQGVVDHLDEGLLTTDPAGVVRFANARAQRMFGYSRDEMAGVTVTKLMPVPFLNTPGVRIGDYIGARPAAHLPKVVGWRKDATTFPVELWVQPMSVDDSSGLVVIIRDITERLRGENLASRLGRLLDSAMEEIYIFDAQTLYFLEVNRGAQRNLGYGLDQLSMMTPLQISEDLDAAMFQSYLGRLRGGDTGHLSYRCRHRRADGSSYPVEVRLNFSREEEPPVFMAIVADISERQAAEERLHQLAHFDALTGLPNRTVLKDRLDQALLAASRNARLVGVFFIDLDRFKPINDRHGHEVGDRVLRAVAERLKQGLRSTDTVARLGGDEFVIVAQGLRTREDAGRLAQKLLDSFQAPLQLDELSLPVTPSIGIALYPLVETDTEGLLRYADSAMYQAKQAGRARYHLFEADLAPERRRRLELQREVHTAIALNQFRARLQPVMAARGSAVTAALLRYDWQHSRHGVIGEDEAALAAQQAGVRADLELWGVYRACELLSEAERVGAAMPPLLVEISAFQLRTADFGLYVADLIDRFRIAPSQLILALRVPDGETLLLHDAAQALVRRGLRFGLHAGAVATSVPEGAPLLCLLEVSAALLVAGQGELPALARQHGMELLVRDVDEPAQAAALVEAGVGHLGGEALLPPQDLADFLLRLQQHPLQPL
ncbi:diguanylate cyclase [Solimonas sp. K1W22B-7]|uniref:sensor domain-containing protein n=1 Tax=Solimonas sp. K1W22B-7 TaxID=2303331 RepID=UPI000E3346A7|nr:diguanylate cyclase [Solimonas sp. K1W22B-7]AXQ30761.1 diguanylate cyclase [Solimonas sp. K1W22B-7]